MKKLKLSCFLAAAIFIGAFSNISFSQTTLEWANKFSIGASSQTAYDIATDSSGNIYVTGSHSKGYSETDMVTVKYNSSGQYQWARTYNLSPDYTSEVGKSIATCRMGTKTFIYTAGEVYTSGSQYITIIKYDDSGNQIWQRNYDPGTQGDFVAKLITDASGNCYITGGISSNPFVAKLDSSGTFIFNTVVPIPSGYTYSQANDMAIDAAGNLYATGSCDTSNSKYYLTFKYNTAGALQWLKMYKTAETYTSTARSIKIGNSGKIYITGEYYTAPGHFDYLTIKYNPVTGDTIWTKKYNAGVNTGDLGQVMAIDGNENIFVSGMSYVGSYQNIHTVKYDSNGVQKWVRTYSGPGGYSDIVKDIVCDNAGNIYLTGVSDNSYFGKYLTMKYNTNGDVVWTREYDVTVGEFDAANSMALDNSGNLIVTGNTGNSGTDIGTIKYNSAGVQLWTTKFNGAQIIEDRSNGIAKDRNGNVYSVGKSKTGQGGDNIVIVKYDPQGNQKWIYNRGGTFAGYNAYDEGKAITVDSNGFVYFTGTVYAHPSSKNEICTGKLDSNGNAIWFVTASGTYSNHGDDEGNDIIVDTLGNVYITGQLTNISGNLDYITVKYNSSGVEQWTRTHGAIPGGNDIANAITLDKNLNVFVTGFSDGAGTNKDMATIKYSGVSGIQQWVKIFNGNQSQNDFGNDIGIDVDGHVYVCGGLDSGAPIPYAIMLKYLNSTGELRWSHYQNEQNMGGVAYFTSLTLNPSKTYVFATGADQWSSDEIGMIYSRYDTNFYDYIYESNLTEDYDMEGKSIAWHDNFIYIAGNSYSQQEGKRLFIERRNESGNTVFSHFYSGNSPSGMTSNNGIVGGKGNCFFVAGNTYDSITGNNITTLKYSYPFYWLVIHYSLEGPQSAFPYGFQDTIRVYIRNSASPYNILDSSKGVNEYSSFLQFMYVYSYFENASSSGTYYLVLKHRNSIETWSRPAQLFSNVYPNFNFTDSAAKAYGSNQKLLTSTPYNLYGFYSGDVNQDGTIDVTDNGLIDNDAFNFMSGYVVSDLNGDGLVDLTDGVFADNNAFNFVSKITP
ncbi:MAG: SBBP repeat-containing protein [Ignavibacteria bacterium]|nr:SBBP repeat-containing protein [Ignavibacteria bacterium]